MGYHDSSVSFASAGGQDWDAAFAVYREALFDDIERNFGWDENDQRQRFMESYPASSLFWCLRRGRKVALLSMRPWEDGAHLHLLLVLPAFQGYGLGQQILRQICSEMFAKGGSLFMSCFRDNPRVVKFWRRMGARVVDEDGPFFLMKLKAEV
jgi:ribosomal protein S18 acetylase RimI-like enzyme